MAVTLLCITRFAPVPGAARFLIKRESVTL
jgi:hypothetical protein